MFGKPYLLLILILIVGVENYTLLPTLPGHLRSGIPDPRPHPDSTLAPIPTPSNLPTAAAVHRANERGTGSL
jgi:hypothetical protein